MSSSGLANVGDSLRCSATCYPPPDANGFEFTIRGQSRVTYASSIELTNEGTYQYICTVYNTEFNERYNASQTARVTVYPRGSKYNISIIGLVGSI